VTGTSDEQSDIDVAVVSDDFSGDLVEDTFKLMQIRRQVDNRIEPHPFLSEDFNNKNPFVKEIMKDMIQVE
jgi:predicted nucleotidyltransferase